MQLSRVVVASPDERLSRELTAELDQVCQLSLTTDLRHVIPLVSAGDVRVLLLDVRQASVTDTSLVALLDELVSHRETTRVLLLPGQNSSWLEPLAAAAECELDHGPLEAQRLAVRLKEMLPTEDVTDADEATTVGVTAAAAPRDSGGVTFGEMVFEGVTRRFETRSPELKKMLEDLMIAAGHDVTILLIGETGSGKTYLSNLIHEASPRRKEPFLHVACGALPRELIEGELFGHMKGAFTSAHADKEGKFVAARRGTILLDEIDVLGPEQQVKLLRVIETGEFEPVGSNQTLRSQARLVVASNLDLQPLVEQGRFRPDLYYRLNMLKFEIPPLRKRKVDIIPMAKKFIARFQEKHSIQIHRIEDALLEALLAYPWPGNVRELEHVIQRAVIYCRNGVLTRDQLPPHFLSGQVGPTNDPTVRLNPVVPVSNHSLESQVALTEKEIIEQALFKNNFSRTKTARDLGISRVTLYNKMKRYDMLK